MNCTKKSCQFYVDGKCGVNSSPASCGLLSTIQLKAHPLTTMERMSRDKIAGLEREIAALKAENKLLKIQRADAFKAQINAPDPRYVAIVAELVRGVKALKSYNKKVIL